MTNSSFRRARTIAAWSKPPGGGTLRDVLPDRRPFFWWALVVGAGAATSLRVLALASGYTLPRRSSGS